MGERDGEVLSGKGSRLWGGRKRVERGRKRRIRLSGKGVGERRGGELFGGERE